MPTACDRQNALYAVHNHEGITMVSECTLHGRWLWALETTPGDTEGDALPSP